MSQRKGFRTAQRRYMAIYIPAMTIYLLAIFSVITFVDTDSASILMRTIIALSVSVPLIAILWSILRLVKETDEYTRQRQLQALTEGGIMLTSVIFVLGFLERFNVIYDIPLFLFGPAFFLFYGIAYARQCFGKTV